MSIGSVNDSDFDAKVLKSDIPVLVFFTAQWSAPVKAMIPIVDELANEWLGKISVYSIDIDDNTDTAQRYHILSIPHFVLFENGKLTAQTVGKTTKEILKSVFQPHIK